MKPKSPRRGSAVPAGEAIFAAGKQKALPHPFVLDALEAAHPETRPMFGCLAVYVGEKIMLVLRDKPGPDPDKGVWLATTPEHHASLRGELPSLRSISVLGAGVTGWQALPASSPDFEDEALRACEMILRGDPRIGKIPGEKKKTTKGKSASAAKTAAKAKPAAKAKSEVEAKAKGKAAPSRSIARP